MANPYRITLTEAGLDRVDAVYDRRRSQAEPYPDEDAEGARCGLIGTCDGLVFLILFDGLDEAAAFDDWEWQPASVSFGPAVLARIIDLYGDWDFAKPEAAA